MSDPSKPVQRPNTHVRAKSQTRQSRFDRHENDVLRAKLDYDDYEENEMVPLVYHPSTLCPSSPRRMKKELDEIREEMNHVRTVKDSTVSKEFYSKLVEDLTTYHQDIQRIGKKIDTYSYVSNKREQGRSDRVKEIVPEWQAKASRYREERNAARAENKLLRQELRNLKADTGEDKACMNYEKDNLQKEIAYFKKKSTNAEEVISEANVAIAHYSEETERYKGISEKVKLDAMRLKMEKEELQSHMQKLRQIAKEEKDDSDKKIEALNQQVIALEAEKQEHAKKIQVLTTTNAWLKTKKSSGQIDPSEQKDDHICQELKSKNEELERNYMELEERFKSETETRIRGDGTIQRYKDDNDRLRRERNAAQHDLHKITRERDDLVKQCQHEVDPLRYEIEKVMREKEELSVLYKAQLKQEEEKRVRLEKEREELQSRLIEASGNNLRNEISEIPNLCDVNRPTSLAEKFSSLYAEEYTDALEEIEDTMDESSPAKVMLDWLKICHEWCEKLASGQRQFMKDKAIGFMEDYMKFRVPVQISERCLIHVKEFQKNIAIDSLAAVTQICLHKSLRGQKWSDNTPIKKYIQRCTELCWMMQINDPPLYVKFDVTPGQPLDKNSYNIFTRSGSQIDYLVWPVLFLHRTGPMLGKGVAQGK